MTRWLGLDLRRVGSALVAIPTACVAPPVGALCPVSDTLTAEEKRAALCACRAQNEHPQEHRVVPLPWKYTADVLLVVGNTPLLPGVRAEWTGAVLGARGT